jgi:hypothetical protein
MTQDLDALPLPKFTDDDADQMLRDMPWCKWSDARELVKACFWKGYELAKREAQEGREPVAWRVRRSDGEHELFFHEPTAKQRAECFVPHSSAEPLYTSPPPKSDEPAYAPKSYRAAHTALGIRMIPDVEVPKSDEAVDAERYRWLRRKVCVIGKSTYCGEETGIPIFDFVNLPDVGEVVNRDSASTLDAAIDAALAAQQKGGAAS